MKINRADLVPLALFVVIVLAWLGYCHDAIKECAERGGVVAQAFTPKLYACVAEVRP